MYFFALKLPLIQYRRKLNCNLSLKFKVKISPKFEPFKFFTPQGCFSPVYFQESFGVMLRFLATIFSWFIISSSYSCFSTLLLAGRDPMVTLYFWVHINTDFVFDDNDNDNKKNKNKDKDKDKNKDKDKDKDKDNNTNVRSYVRNVTVQKEETQFFIC